MNHIIIIIILIIIRGYSTTTTHFGSSIPTGHSTVLFDDASHSLSHSFTLSHLYLESIVNLKFYISAYIVVETYHFEFSFIYFISANLMLPFECR